MALGVPGGDLKAGIGVIVLTAVLAAPAMLPAQIGAAESGQLVPDMPPIPDRPEAAFLPAKLAGPRYPLEVQILEGRWMYNGNHEYKGKGSLQVEGQPGKPVSYTYRCVNSFEEAGLTYPARWVKPGRKLEILMISRGSKHTKACRLSVRR